jgi:hypothetical protein
MYNQPKILNAVATIRVSSTKQGTEGDSPEAQREQIEQFARARNIRIRKVFVFLESASRAQQPMQEAIDYCKDPKHNIQLFIVKSIDRFTRLGSYTYTSLKTQLEARNVRLTDIYGIIGAQKVNTLEHLGVSYKWSVYDPTKNSEILEAERASDEKRDIMSRMIGAEVRYTRLGYWMRRPLYGYVNVRVETRNGKRCMLRPHLIEAPLIIKIFELRSRNTLTDQQIADEVNKLGFKTRTNFIRSKQDKTKIIRESGGCKLTVKHLQRLIHNTVYAGVNTEGWTGGQPVKLRAGGLIPIDLFNAANRGNIVIIERDGEIKVRHKATMQQKLIKGVHNPEYPYKRIIMCPICNHALGGSASRGKLGKYYPAYHCSTRGHQFRVPKPQFDATITDYLNCVQVSPVHTGKVLQAVIEEWELRQDSIRRDNSVVALQAVDLKSQAKMLVNNLKFLKSETAVRYMEEDLLEIEKQLATIKQEQLKKKGSQPDTRETLRAQAAQLLQNLSDLILGDNDPTLKGVRLGLLFTQAPTYDDLTSSIRDKTPLDTMSKLFKISSPSVEKVSS